MASASEPLMQLEEIDGRLEAERDRLQSIEHQLRGDPEIESSRKRLVALQGELEQRQSRLRSLEAQAADLSGTIKRLNDMLYGGRIHDAREMASAEAEITHATQGRAHLEDEEIELLEQVESLEAQIAVLTSRIETLTSQREHNLRDLREEMEHRKTALAKLELDRDGLVKGIDPGRYQSYSRLRSRHGHAVSVVTDGICQCCRVQIPPADIQHARGNSIVTCTNCSRILYAG